MGSSDNLRHSACMYPAALGVRAHCSSKYNNAEYISASNKIMISVVTSKDWLYEKM